MTESQITTSTLEEATLCKEPVNKVQATVPAKKYSIEPGTVAKAAAKITPVDKKTPLKKKAFEKTPSPKRDSVVAAPSPVLSRHRPLLLTKANDHGPPALAVFQVPPGGIRA